jgi:hypothetical protein
MEVSPTTSADTPSQFLTSASTSMLPLKKFKSLVTLRTLLLNTVVPSPSLTPQLVLPPSPSADPPSSPTPSAQTTTIAQSPPTLPSLKPSLTATLLLLRLAQLKLLLNPAMDSLLQERFNRQEPMPESLKTFLSPVQSEVQLAAMALLWVPSLL